MQRNPLLACVRRERVCFHYCSKKLANKQWFQMGFIRQNRVWFFPLARNFLLKMGM